MPRWFNTRPWFHYDTHLGTKKYLLRRSMIPKIIGNRKRTTLAYQLHHFRKDPDLIHDMDINWVDIYGVIQNIPQAKVLSIITSEPPLLLLLFFIPDLP